MLDFSQLLTALADEVKKKPNQKPEQQPLPSEHAIGEIGQGLAEQQDEATQGVAGEITSRNDDTPISGESYEDDMRSKSFRDLVANPPTNLPALQQTFDPVGRGKQDAEGRYGASHPAPGLKPASVNSNGGYDEDETTGYNGDGSPPSIQMSGESDKSSMGSGQEDVPQRWGVSHPGSGLSAEDSLSPPPPSVTSKGDENAKPRTLDEKIAYQQQKVLDARDAKVEKQSFWKDFGAKLIQGADAFFNGNRAPIEGWGTIKHDQAVRREENALNPLLGMKNQQQASQKAAQDMQMGSLEYQLKVNKGVQDMFNNDPDIMLIKAGRNRVDAATAARLNAKFNAQYTPTYWGKFVTAEVGGKQYIRPEDSPNYAENTSIPADPIKGTVGVPLSGGGIGYTESGKAVEQDNNARIAGISNNRQIATTDANNKIEVAKANATAINNYNNLLVTRSLQIATALSQIGKEMPKDVVKYEGDVAKAKDDFDKAREYGNESAALTASDQYMVSLDKLTKAFQRAALRDAQMKNALESAPLPSRPTLVKFVPVDIGNNQGTPGKPKKDTLKLF